MHANLTTVAAPETSADDVTNDTQRDGVIGERCFWEVSVEVGADVDEFGHAATVYRDVRCGNASTHPETDVMWTPNPATGAPYRRATCDGCCTRVDHPQASGCDRMIVAGILTNAVTA